MDASYERNVTTLLTTIISNATAIVLLGIYGDINITDYSDELLLEKKDDIRSYAGSLHFLVVFPIVFVMEASKALCHFIKGISVGMPYKYIRLLSQARYFIGYDSDDERYGK
jgi:hypothetical protein